MSQRSTDAGFSLIEVFIVMVVTMTIAAIVVPKSGNLFGNLRLSGDARSISNSVALAKMRAAADFTRARLYVDVGARSYRVERFQKTGAPGWVAEGDFTPLSYGVNLNTGGKPAAPPNTQGVINQAPACTDAGGAAIANSACIVFNSRGVPVDNAGLPTAADAIYLSNGSAVYGVTVAATGQIRVWKSGLGAAAWTNQ